jgi:hypothetical protein
MFLIEQLSELKISLQGACWVETRHGGGLADPLRILLALLVSLVNFRIFGGCRFNGIKPFNINRRGSNFWDYA